MTEKRKAETSTEEPVSKVNKTANIDSTHHLIDENELLKKKIAELEKRDEDAQKMTKEMNDRLMIRLDEAESKAFNSDSKLSMLKHLTRYKYLVNQPFDGKTKHNLSQEIIDVIFKNDNNCELPKEEMRRTPVIKYRNYVIYYMNKNTVFYERPPAPRLAAAERDEAKIRDSKFGEPRFTKPKFGEAYGYGNTQ
jgi:hypothetical protein